MQKIGIIIVNYKDYAEKYLADCRDGLRAQTYPKELTRIYIVDNASNRESFGYLREHFSEAEIIIRPDGNYAAANNAGIKKAVEDGCGAFAILNLDVKLNPDWLFELALALKKNPEAGITQSKILLYSGNSESSAKINSLGNICHFLGFGYTGGYNDPDREISGYPEITGYPSGCSFILRKSALEKIGGYNENFFMYHDDMEIGLKARLAGFKIILAPRSIVYHKYEFHRSVKMLYFMERNRYLIMFMFYKLPTLILLLPAILVMDLGILFYSIPGGWLKTKLAVYAYFFRPSSWRKIRVARKNIRSIRNLNDRELTRDFSGRILFQEIDNPVLKYIANPFLNFYWNLAKWVIWW